MRKEEIQEEELLAPHLLSCRSNIAVEAKVEKVNKGGLIGALIMTDLRQR